MVITTTNTWTPPEHFAPAPIDDDEEDKSVFDADTLEACADDKELWLIRIPDNLTAADLEGITMKMPNESEAATVKIGDSKYNVQCMASDASTATGGREMRSMHCLVPSEDKLVLAPLPFAQHITLTHAVDIPSSKKLAKEIQAKTIQKRAQPDGMKMQFPLSCIATKSSIAAPITEDEPMEEVRVKSEQPKKKHKTQHSEVETPQKKKKKSKH